MDQAKLPNPMRILCGSLTAWWRAYILNPGFFAVAIMLLLMIPILVIELYLTTSKTSVPLTASMPNDDNSVQENTA